MCSQISMWPSKPLVHREHMFSSKWSFTRKLGPSIGTHPNPPRQKLMTATAAATSTSAAASTASLASTMGPWLLHIVFFLGISTSCSILVRRTINSKILSKVVEYCNKHIATAAKFVEISHTLRSHPEHLMSLCSPAKENHIAQPSLLDKLQSDIFHLRCLEDHNCCKRINLPQISRTTLAEKD